MADKGQRNLAINTERLLLPSAFFWQSDAVRSLFICKAIPLLETWTVPHKYERFTGALTGYTLREAAFVAFHKGHSTFPVQGYKFNPHPSLLNFWILTHMMVTSVCCHNFEVETKVLKENAPLLPWDNGCLGFHFLIRRRQMVHYYIFLLFCSIYLLGHYFIFSTFLQYLLCGVNQ